MRVYVYYNLHKHLFSVRALEGENKGRVVAHVKHISLEDVVFKVSKAGRARVLREQRKNVHAGARGTWVVGANEPHSLTQVTYNPYLYSTFVQADTLEPVYNASYAYLHDKRIFAQL
jgi:hypothetical protein